MSSQKHKLRLVGSFAALASLALAISCRGFFVNPTLTAINIAPSAPQVQLNNQITLTVYGTYNDGSTNQVSKGVSWSSATPTVAAFASPTSNVLQGLSIGTSTITANAQAVTATATATVYLGNITKIVVQPTSGNVSASNTSTTAGPFTATATSNGTAIDITQTATWTLSPSTTGISCTIGTVGTTTGEVCNSVSGNQLNGGTYTLTASYPGTTLVGTASITVSP